MGGRDARRRGPKVRFIAAMVAALIVATLGLHAVTTPPRPVVAETAHPAVTASTVTAVPVVTPLSSVPTSQPPPPVRPTEVMVIGDSGTWDMYPALEQGFAAAGVEVSSAAFPGEGLTTPVGIRRLWYDAAAWRRADYFVISIGTWDDLFIAWHGWQAYLDEIDDTVRTLTKHGAHVLWLSMMPSDDPEPDAHAKPRLQDRLYSALPDRYPGVVEYLDIGPALTAPDGTSPRVLDGRLLRKPDGWHLCPDGAAAVAHAVLGHLGLDTTGWENGSWRRDARYDDPPGSCPSR